VPKLATEAEEVTDGAKEVEVMEAFYILNNWFFYGVPPDEENLYQMFESSCSEQRREIIIALRQYFHNLKETELLEKLVKKLMLRASLSFSSEQEYYFSEESPEQERYYPEERVAFAY